MVELTLYVRDGCHLCEEMRRRLQPLIDANRVRLETRDVDSDPGWFAAYDTRVPVLMAGERLLCDYVLDEAALAALLA